MVPVHLNRTPLSTNHLGLIFLSLIPFLVLPLLHWGMGREKDHCVSRFAHWMARRSKKACPKLAVESTVIFMSRRGQVSTFRWQQISVVPHYRVTQKLGRLDLDTGFVGSQRQFYMACLEQQHLIIGLYLHELDGSHVPFKLISNVMAAVINYVSP